MKKDKEMLRIIIFTIIFTLIMSSILPYYKVASAAEGSAEIKFSINGGTGGEVKAGSDVEIDVDLNNLSNFYAGSVNYKYDNTLLEINSIDISPKIKENNIYEAYKDKANNGNIARYGFTIMGGKSGISGSTRFLTIKATAKKDGNLEINSSDVEYQLVQKTGDGTMKDIGGQFLNGKEKSSETTDGSNSSNKSELTTSDEGNATNDSNSGDGSSSGSNSSTTEGNGTNGIKQDKAEGNESDSENEAIGASESLEKSFDGAGSDSGSNDVKNNSNHNYVYIIIGLGFIVIVAGAVFLYRKKRNKDKITINN